MGLKISSMSERRAGESAQLPFWCQWGTTASSRWIPDLGTGRNLFMPLVTWGLGPLLASFWSRLLTCEILVVSLRIVKSVSKMLIMWTHTIFKVFPALSPSPPPSSPPSSTEYAKLTIPRAYPHIPSFNSCSSSSRVVLLFFTFCRWRNWSTSDWFNLPRATHPMSVEHVNLGSLVPEPGLLTAML